MERTDTCRERDTHVHRRTGEAPGADRRIAALDSSRLGILRTTSTGKSQLAPAKTDVTLASLSHECETLSRDEVADAATV